MSLPPGRRVPGITPASIRFCQSQHYLRPIQQTILYPMVRYVAQLQNMFGNPVPPDPPAKPSNLKLFSDPPSRGLFGQNNNLSSIGTAPQNKAVTQTSGGIVTYISSTNVSQFTFDKNHGCSAPLPSSASLQLAPQVEKRTDTGVEGQIKNILTRQEKMEKQIEQLSLQKQQQKKENQELRQKAILLEECVKNLTSKLEAVVKQLPDKIEAATQPRPVEASYHTGDIKELKAQLGLLVDMIKQRDQYLVEVSKACQRHALAMEQQTSQIKCIETMVRSNNQVGRANRYPPSTDSDPRWQGNPFIDFDSQPVRNLSQSAVFEQRTHEKLIPMQLQKDGYNIKCERGTDGRGHGLVVWNQHGRIEFLSPVGSFHLRQIYSLPRQVVHIVANQCEIKDDRWLQYMLRLVCYNFMDSRNMPAQKREQLIEQLKEYSLKSEVTFERLDQSTGDLHLLNKVKLPFKC